MKGKYNINVINFFIILIVCIIYIVVTIWRLNASIPFLVVLACIFGLPLVLFIDVQAYSYLRIWLNGAKLRKALQKQNRILSLEEAKEKIRSKQGKIVVDAPTLGWNVSRILWSPTVDFTPRPESWDKTMVCPQEDIKNYSRYIDQMTGIAKLVDAFVITQRVNAYLKKHFGSNDHGFIFTGGVLFQQELIKRKSESAT